MMLIGLLRVDQTYGNQSRLEEIGMHHEKTEEQLEGKKWRRSLWRDRFKNRGAQRLAQRYTCSSAEAHQTGRSRSCRRGEMAEAVEFNARRAGVVALWNHLHRGNVQECRQVDLRQ